jgi:hypothetical protein
MVPSAVSMMKTRSPNSLSCSSLHATATRSHVVTGRLLLTRSSRSITGTTNISHPDADWRSESATEPGGSQSGTGDSDGNWSTHQSNEMPAPGQAGPATGECFLFAAGSRQDLRTEGATFRLSETALTQALLDPAVSFAVLCRREGLVRVLGASIGSC